MPGTILSLTIGLAALFDTSVVFGQIVKQRVLLERKPLKVVADQTFPKNLSCEFYLSSPNARIDGLGFKGSPVFGAEGKNGRIDQASMHVGFRASVIVLRKDGDNNSYLLHLFLTEKAGLTSLFDLNLDGKWDYKWVGRRAKMSSFKSKQYILVDNKWIEVEKTNGPRSKTPTATIGRKKYVFKNEWKAVPTTP
jgi:hypothetical protein